MLEKIKKFILNREVYYPNIYVFGYFFLKAIKKSFLAIGLIRPQKLDKDMFDWPLYYLHYKGELKEMKKKYLLSLSAGDYEFSDGKLDRKNPAEKPLHNSHRFLYETILMLKPRSIFELGCGTGINLHNLKILSPGARICGIDISDRQLEGLKKSYPDLKEAVKPADATVPFTTLPFDRCDIAYTQAVLMHIHTEDLHLAALANLFKMADKYVILMESERKHRYLDDINKLFSKGMIDWDNHYFYNRIDPETKQPLSIICSREKLNDNFIELHNYKY
jgi:SAM-dependent methyltransferase